MLTHSEANYPTLQELKATIQCNDALVYALQLMCHIQCSVSNKPLEKHGEKYNALLIYSVDTGHTSIRILEIALLNLWITPTLSCILDTRDSPPLNQVGSWVALQWNTSK